MFNIWVFCAQVLVLVKAPSGWKIFPSGLRFLCFSPSTPPKPLPCNLLHILTEEDDNKGNAHQEEQQ